MKNIGIKSFLGLLNLFVMMSLAIFLPAGTTRYPFAWLYLLIFFGSVTIITIYIFRHDQHLLQSRLKVGTLAEKRMSQKIIQSFASIGFIGMYIVSGFDHRYHWSAVPCIVAFMGTSLVGLAMYFMFIVFKKNTFLSATIEVQSEQTIVTDGPYALVRHPMYAAAFLLFIFTPFALKSYWGLICAPFMVMVLIARCLDEEKALEDELPAYREYEKKVKYRLIPYFW